MKLAIEIIANKDPLLLLTRLANEKFHATEISAIPGGNMLNIDAGMNDIRAIVDKNTIKFYFRYEKDSDKYERLIIDFCKEHSITLRFE